MPMTIRELVAEPHLGLELIAGVAGLEQQITWSHTSDLPKLWEWVSDGVLLLTNGMSIPSDEAGQIELAHKLVRSGAVGLAIGEKMHAPALHEGFFAVCEELPLAVLSVPYPLPFIAISRSIAEALLIEESRRIKQTARIYDVLRRANSPTDVWQVLREELSSELKSTLHILDKQCLHLWNGLDAPPSSELVEAIKHAEKQAKGNTRNFQWLTHNGQSILMMDIPMHANTILVVAPEPDAPHPDGVILLHCATVFGLAMSQEIMLTTQSHRAANALLSQVVHGGALPDELPDGPFSNTLMRLACLPPLEYEKIQAMSQRLQRHGIENAAATTEDASYIFFDDHGSAELLWHVLEDAGNVGVSSALTVRQLPRATRESRWMRARAAEQLGGLLFYTNDDSWFGMAGHREGEELVARLLGPILDYDQRTHADLVGTLRMYLELQRSPQKVASQTYTHRQTVISRLRKIEQLANVDLSETAVVAQLWMAFKAHDTLVIDGSPALG